MSGAKRCQVDFPRGSFRGWEQTLAWRCEIFRHSGGTALLWGSIYSYTVFKLRVPT